MSSLVVDASAVVAALTDAGSDGSWAREQLASESLAAPHLLPAETANILRRAGRAGELSPEVASLAHGDLLALRIELYPYPPVAHRAWELREHLTTYDAWYVALAEALGAPLATLDARLGAAPGPMCEFLLPA